jgi:hypothetical protein
MVFGISVIGLLSFTSAPVAPSPVGGIGPITVEQANSYVKNYVSDATSINQVIKGFYVDKAQLEAMNNLASENPEFSGFRLYFGKDANGRKVGVVVGVDITGKDAFKNTIFGTDSPNSSPCPPVCDVNSPITTK